MSVSSTTRELLVFLKESFGGHISTQKLGKSHYKPSWSWKLIRGGALDMLEVILPYLKEPEKIRRAALLVKKYRKVTVRNGKYSEPQLREKIAFENEFFINGKVKVSE